MSESEFLMWGERGLVASFFADLHAAGTAGFHSFLNSVEIDSPSFPRQGESVLTIIEPDFSNTGFGHPDAIVRVNGPNGSTVLILEAKRTSYAKACRPSALRASEHFNSKLNGQLELDYMLAVALERYRKGEPELVEPEWVLSTPYSQERRGSPRRLKKACVLRGVASRFGGLRLDNYFFIVLTTDLQNPFATSTDSELLPELYHPDCGSKNCWPEKRLQFGWLNYDSLEDVVQDLIAKGLLQRSLFLDSWKLNRSNMAFVGSGDTISRVQQQAGPSQSFVPSLARQKSRGVSMIYAPQIAESFVHFSWKGESCAIRDYSRGPDRAPLPNRTRRTSDVRRLTEREVAVPGRRLEDTKYWHGKTIELNQTLAGGS